MSLRWGTAGHNALLAVLALVVGLALVALPPAWSVALLVGGGLLALTAIEPLAGLAVTLSVAPLKTLIGTEASVALPADPGQVALLITVVAWFMRKVADRETIALLRSPVFPPLLLFIGAAALSLAGVGVPSLGAGLSELLKWAEIALVAALTIDLIASAESRLRWAVMAVIMAGVGQALIGLYEFFGGSGANHLAILDGRHYRAFGSFGQPNPFAGFVGICLMLGLGITWGALTDTLTSRASILSGETVVKRAKGARSVSALWQTVVYAVLTALLGAALLASWSRGAWMGVAAAGVVMALFLPRRLRTGLLVVGVLVALVVGLWASGRLPTAIVERVMGGLTRDLSPLSAGAPASVADVRGVDIGDANYAEIERLAHWQAAVNMALAHPWLGVGFGNYAAAYPAYALMNWPEPLGHAHNYLLNLLAETGLIGLAAYIVLWVAILGLTLRALGRSKGYRRGLALGLLGVWTHLITHNLVDKLYVNNVFLDVGVLLGILAVLLADESTVSSQVISTQGRGA